MRARYNPGVHNSKEAWMLKPIGAVNCLYPMPTVLVGAQVDGKPNFLTVAWVGIVAHNAISIASNKDHFTNVGIRQHQTFSVNIPSEAQVKETDYCGLVSGSRTDKSNLFECFYGSLKTAPMIATCPLCMECRVRQTLDIDDHELFVGEIVQAYASESVLTAGTVDFAKVKPTLFELPTGHYWKLGEPLAKAWEVGRQLLGKSQI